MTTAQELISHGEQKTFLNNCWTTGCSRSAQAQGKQLCRKMRCSLFFKAGPHSSAQLLQSHPATGVWRCSSFAFCLNGGRQPAINNILITTIPAAVEQQQPPANPSLLWKPYASSTEESPPSSLLLPGYTTTTTRLEATVIMQRPGRRRKGVHWLPPHLEVYSSFSLAGQQVHSEKRRYLLLHAEAMTTS